MTAAGATFPDHFSAQASLYAAWRPHYPAALFEAIALHLPRPPLRSWEPGCGSGQATFDLADRFGSVFATDPSTAQVEAHPAGRRADPRITLAVEPAENCSLPDGSVQLIAVGQALHWFDRPAFFAECTRVLSPGGVLAAWCYQDFVPPAVVDTGIGEFRDAIELHWPAQRLDVDAAYAGYAWPFQPLRGCDFEMHADWTLPHLLGYLSSLSATARAMRVEGSDPVARHAGRLAEAWGDAEVPRRIAWPAKLTMCRKE